MKIRNIKILSGLLTGFIILSSCFKEEIPIIPIKPGNIETATVEIGETYLYQSYFDLETNTTVKSNKFSDWDLAFSTSDTVWLIRLNNAKKMFAGTSFTTNFEDVISEDGIDMWFDRSDGNPDSVVLNGWVDLSGGTPVSFDYVYVINRGFDENFGEAGYKKIVFETPENQSYKIRYADLDGQNEQTYTVEKDTSFNHICFSFDTGIVDIEPPKDEWSLLFTLYQTLYQDLEGYYQPYVVTGALLNPNNVSSNIDTLLEFNDITLNDAHNYEFRTELDIIGFDWKYYNFEEGFYTIVEDQNYLIKNNDGFFYKMRFIDFYNNEGKKGYPTFEFARL